MTTWVVDTCVLSKAFRPIVSGLTRSGKSRVDPTDKSCKQAISCLIAIRHDTVWSTPIELGDPIDQGGIPVPKAWATWILGPDDVDGGPGRHWFPQIENLTPLMAAPMGSQEQKLLPKGELDRRFAQWAREHHCRVITENSKDANIFEEVGCFPQDWPQDEQGFRQMLREFQVWIDVGPRISDDFTLETAKLLQKFLRMRM